MDPDADRAMEDNPGLPQDGPPPPNRDAYRRTTATDAELTDLEALIRLCHVPRWVTVPLLRPQSVAEHSYRVAIISLQLLRQLGKMAEVGHVVTAALIHERSEATTGDIPAPLKKGSATDLNESPIHSLGEYVLKLADLIEAFSYLGCYGYSSIRRQEILENYREAITGQIALIREKFGAIDGVALLPVAVDELLMILKEAK